MPASIIGVGASAGLALQAVSDAAPKLAIIKPARKVGHFLAN
jgi:hypothetical protein